MNKYEENVYKNLFEYPTKKIVELELENEKLQHENQQLKEMQCPFLGTGCKRELEQLKKQKDELQKEKDYVDDYNRHLLKQKANVIEYIKYNATSNYFDKDKNMFRREIDILRMLGEIDE